MICHKFYNEKLWKEKFETVLYLDLEEVCKYFQSSSLFDFYQYYAIYLLHSTPHFYSSSSLSSSSSSLSSSSSSVSGKIEVEGVMKKLKEMNEKGKLCWVLDGFEKLVSKTEKQGSLTQTAKKMIDLILQNEKENNPFHHILVTSSFHCERNSSECLSLEIGVFGENQQSLFIQKFFDQLIPFQFHQVWEKFFNSFDPSFFSVPLHLFLFCLAFDLKRSFKRESVLVEDTPFLVFLFSCSPNLKFFFSLQSFLFEKNFRSKLKLSRHKHIIQDLANCFNQMDKPSFSYVSHFFEEFQVDKVSWMLSILFKFGNNLDLIKSLINFDENLQDRFGNSPLHLACENLEISLPVIEFLVEKVGSYLTCKNKQGNTPLHLACENQRISLPVIKFLIEKGSPLNSTNNISDTPLHLACKNQNIPLDLVEFLVEKGSDWKQKNTLGFKVIYYLDKNIDLKKRFSTKYGSTPYKKVFK